MRVLLSRIPESGDYLLELHPNSKKEQENLRIIIQALRNSHHNFHIASLSVNNKLLRTAFKLQKESLK